MAKVEVKNERPTYTLHLNENEFWALLVAFGESSGDRRTDCLALYYPGVPGSVDVSSVRVGYLYDILQNAAVTA